MQKIFKNIVVLYIICNNDILMRKFIHQDYEVIDVFGFNDSEDNDIDIRNKLICLFGKTFPYYYYGKIESVINKEGVTAYITTKAYKILLDQKYRILTDYSDDVAKNGGDIIWVNRNEIKNEKRLREGDKKTLERVFDDKNLNIKMIENQGERWIDAKTVLYEDN
jgi:hypothetical protein